jgi:hypothetical protein
MNEYTITVPEEDLKLAHQALEEYRNSLMSRVYEADRKKDSIYAQVCYDEQARVSNIIQQIEDLL